MLLLWIILLILVFFAAAGIYFALRILKPNVQSAELSYQKKILTDRSINEYYQALVKQEVWIPSPYGYKLHGIYLSLEGSHKTVVITHGIETTLFASVKYVELFRSSGFNVLLYDLRNHGSSGGKNTTFGYYEKYDLRAVVEWAFMRTGPGGLVGTMGESLGGAISIQHAAIDSRVAFCIAASSFSDFKQLLIYRFKFEFKLPVFPFLQLANFMTAMLSGMSFDAVSPLRDIVEISLPVMLIHGADDRYIPVQMSKDLYEAKKKGIRSIYLAQNAGHADSFTVNREEYTQQVRSFLGKIGMLD
jgi:fermentation-respiration switch protein FrsA (DUF1100 family)